MMVKDDGSLESTAAATPKPSCFRAGRHSLPLGRQTYLTAILNRTPDSFSDGGRHFAMDQALKAAETMLREGADILDVGGESTRPGSQTVSDEEEIERVVPLIEKISSLTDRPISIDTYKPAVAKAGLQAGACIVNDIYGLQQDEAMVQVIREHDAGVILMHNARFYRCEEQGHAGQSIRAKPDEAERYGQLPLMQRVLEYLQKSVTIANRAGLDREQLLVDPGLGFGVTAEESIEMLRDLGRLHELGLAVLIGPSRKRFIGHLVDWPAKQRAFGTAAAVAIGIAHGADFVRVHDVAAMRDVIRVSDALSR